MCSFHRWTSSFQLLAIVNSAAIHMGVPISLRDPILCFCGYTPRSGTAGSYDSSPFQFTRSCHPVFCRGGTILQSCQKYPRALISRHPRHHLCVCVFCCCSCFLFVFVLIPAILMGVDPYLTVVLLRISPTVNGSFSHTCWHL